MIAPLLRGCYPYFSILAVAVMIWRLKTGRWTRAETIVAVALLLHILLEILQIVIADRIWVIYRRYLLPVAPLFVIWLGYGLVELYHRYHVERYWKWLLVPAVPLVLFLLFDGMRPALRHRFAERKGTAAQVIRIAGAWIRADYHGEAVTAAPTALHFYHSPFLPTVYSAFPALGEACGGRSEPSLFGDAPDYWVLPDSDPAPEDGIKVYAFPVRRRTFIIYRRRSAQP